MPESFYLFIGTFAEAKERPRPIKAGTKTKRLRRRSAGPRLSVRFSGKLSVPGAAGEGLELWNFTLFIWPNERDVVQLLIKGIVFVSVGS